MLPADGPAKHWLNRALTNFKGVKGAVSNGAARNLVWMPIVTCLLYAGLKMAEGNPDDILANCQVGRISSFCCARGCCAALPCCFLAACIIAGGRGGPTCTSGRPCFHRALLCRTLYSIHALLWALPTLLHYTAPCRAVNAILWPLS